MGSVDAELELALQLSKQTYAEELRKRECEKLNSPVYNDLIGWEDTKELSRRRKVDDINRLIKSSSFGRRNCHWSHAQPEANLCTFSNVNSSLVPTIIYDHEYSSPQLDYTIHHDNHIRKDSFPLNMRISPCAANNSLSRMVQSNPTLKCSSFYVPFASTPKKTQFKDDLIDLGDSYTADRSNMVSTYEQLRDEFDPLYTGSSAMNVKQSGIQLRKSVDDALDMSRLQTLTPPLFSRSDSTPKARPPPPKPPRVDRMVRSGSVDSKRLSFSSSMYKNISINDIALVDCTCEIDQQIDSLKNRIPKTCSSTAKLFISPIVDYTTTNLTVTSVKLIVEKDYSWPSKLGSDNKVVFTCETKGMVQDILATVLATVLDPEQIEKCDGKLPVDEYGLKIYGIDEFLLTSSLLMENHFVGQALAFGNDIRLEVGKLDVDFIRNETGQLDVSSFTSASRTNLRLVERRVLTASKGCVQEVLDVLRKEMIEFQDDFLIEKFGKVKQVVNQAVKLLYTILGRIMPVDLSNALHLYTSALDVEQMADASRKLVIALHRLIRTYCSSVRCNFSVLPLKTSFEADERKCREILSVDESLVLQIESLHNIPESWHTQFYAYCISVHVMHGSSELCRSVKQSLMLKDYDHSILRSTLNIAAAFDIPLCVLPRETRILLLLIGLYHTPSSVEQHQSSRSVVLETQLASVSFPVFNHLGTFRQCSLILPMSLADGSIVQPWGALPLAEEEDDLFLLVSMPQYHYDIVFPHIGYGESGFKRDFESLDLDTRQYILDIIEGGVTHDLSSDEKELLWEKRLYLMHIPESLPLVLASAVAWDWASLNNVYQLIDDWMPCDPIQAIELLLPHFPDVIVREKALSWLKVASPDFIFNLLPELLEALRFEAVENSPLAVYLITLCADDRRLAFELYWLLQQRIHHPPEQAFKNRCKLLQEQIFSILGGEFMVDIQNQHLLIRILNHISDDMRDASDSSKKLSVLRRHLSLLDARILENNVRLPILPSFRCTGINVSESSFFNSFTKPMKIVFKGLKTSYSILYKVGDDIRQDAVVLQLVKVINDIWLSQGLDLRMVVFRCMSLGYKTGMVELVASCRTLCEIQKSVGATGVFKDDLLKNWLQMQNPTEFQYKIALENFQLSCAGWCVVTYVLGIGDRHNDNILVTTKGHVFHIDFGKYMGDWQKAGGFRRDRVPFIFTSDMAYVINDGSSQSATVRYQLFVDNCCKAFNLLRKKYSLLINLMKLVTCSGIPGMDMDAVNFVQSNLMLNLSKTQATVQFTRMIEESLKSKFPRLNFFAHTLVQLKSSPSMIYGGYDDPNKLSFVPQLYTAEQDGRIVSVVVLSFEKWHVPEKVYMFKLEVRRTNETVSSIIYRSFAEFSELYMKLCRRFPIAALPALSQTFVMGRSNIRSVAESRQADIQLFIFLLFEHNNEIAHCDLVYTFFHIIYRDSAPEEFRKLSNVSDVHSCQRTNAVTGYIFLRITYCKQQCTLSVFVGHVKGLKTINRQAPDSYVKAYLHPDLHRVTKKKTRVIKNTQMPTFNEELYYSLVDEKVIMAKALEVSVWNCGSIVGENCVIGSVNIPLTSFEGAQLDRRGNKTIDGWFRLIGHSSRS